jgi:hypothetical protein
MALATILDTSTGNTVQKTEVCFTGVMETVRAIATAHWPLAA